MSELRTGQPVEILLAEDNTADVELTREALIDAKLSVNLQVVPDGVEALAFLRREGDYAAAPRPDLILLDLNMPRKGGHEVLLELKADEDLKRIPVVILTTSEAEEDINRAYSGFANCYITKPPNFEQFVKIVHSIEEFWFTMVRLPTGE